MSSLMMFSTRLLARRSLPSIRTNFRLFRSSNPVFAERNMEMMIKPTSFQKFVLVRAGIFKSMGEVPDRVTYDQMKRGFDKFRGKSMILFIFMFVGGSYLAMLSGRKLRDSGETLTTRGTQQIEYWQEKERYRLEREANQKPESH